MASDKFCDDIVPCDKCQGLSGDVNCTNCGIITVEVVNDEPEERALTDQQAVPSESEQKKLEEASGLEEPEAKSRFKLKRKREVNSLGMFLMERKQKLKKGSKLDMDLEMETWRNMCKDEKAKYKEMSIEDKKRLKKPDVKQKADEGVVIEKKKAKNLKDSQVKAERLRSLNEMKVDVQTSVGMLQSMIVEKKASIAELDVDIVKCDSELENIQRELTVSDKLISVKSANLAGLKKEYKELYSRNKKSSP